MSLVESVRDLDRDAQEIAGRERSLVDAGREVLAVQVLHDEKVDAVLVADIVKDADVGVIEAGSRAGLPLEAGADFGICGKLFGEHFDRDRAVEAAVLGEVDLAHPARAERAENLVGAESCARDEWHEAGRLAQRPCAAQWYGAGVRGAARGGPSNAYVFCSFFSAAGKRTLFRISR